MKSKFWECLGLVSEETRASAKFLRLLTPFRSGILQVKRAEGFDFEWEEGFFGWILCGMVRGRKSVENVVIDEDDSDGFYSS